MLTHQEKSMLRSALRIQTPHASRDRTIEHCIPKSVYRLYTDCQNYILLPSSLNRERSNYKLSAHRSRIKWQKGAHGSFYNPRLRLFVPPQEYRGLYARSILYSALYEKRMIPIINAQVLDLETAWKWHMEYPPTMEEVLCNQVLMDMGVRDNPFKNQGLNMNLVTHAAPS